MALDIAMIGYSSDVKARDLAEVSIYVNAEIEHAHAARPPGESRLLR
ncbi:hypothetical protein [Clavibacter sp. VKM Ac-2872]|nr:hypothetical protein [Clavibacter sp. VKM Ac-2872]MBF4623274.1 hypothetical protein [Clavibacter sp. VKM Ac-2872]